MSEVAKERIHCLNREPVQTEGQYILYWMVAYRRPFYNFALQHAVAMAKELNRPLLILEALRCDYPYASQRLHKFILEGMADNCAHFAGSPAFYFPFVEEQKGAGKGLLQALAKDACLVVSDAYPGFFLPRMQQAAAERLTVALELVDSNGLLPLRAADQDYPTAYAFRRFLQKVLPGELFAFPQRDPLVGSDLARLKTLPKGIRDRWPAADQPSLAAAPQRIADLPIDQNVKATPEKGGWQEAERYLQRFLEDRLIDYPLRSEPDRQVCSELSPYLHFGHISCHQIVAELLAQEDWSPDRLSPEVKGKKSGWWGLSDAAEQFLDELVTWREVGFNTCYFRPAYDQYSSLPEWALVSLEKHRNDPRPILYEREDFEQARTHDLLWNAAQRQLLREGRLQNYLRMLWGKKIFEWSPDPETALQTMLTLNDKYALDGRDLNSVSGIFWCLGRYDRAWGERPIFGKIRYMSSENTARKFSVKGYLQKYGPREEGP